MLSAFKGVVLIVLGGAAVYWIATAGLGDLVDIVLLCLIVGTIYFLPSIVAFNRAHQSGAAILLLNIGLGWTLLGWFLALIWSLSGTDHQRALEMARLAPVDDEDLEDEKVCPRCAETIRSAAKICRYCRHEF